MAESLVDLAAALEAAEAVRDAARQVLREQWRPERLRTMLDDDAPGWAPDLWATVTDLGWDALLVPEAGGGGGGSVAQLAGIAEEVGRAVAPIPFVPAAVAAWCAGPSSTVRTVAAAAPVRARTEGDHIVLSGTASFVPYASVADQIVVAAGGEDADSPVLCVVDAGADGAALTSLRALDASPLADVALVDVRVDVLAEGAEARRLLDGARARLAIGWAAELVGVAAAVHEAATEYAKHRIAFGRPIGAFQAVKHRLVDLRGDIEVARALVRRAAQAVDTGAPDTETTVALAAFWAAEHLRAVPEGAIQVFGGIGYTWEHDAHLHLRRAAVLTALLPRPDSTAATAAHGLVAGQRT